MIFRKSSSLNVSNLHVIGPFFLTPWSLARHTGFHLYPRIFITFLPLSSLFPSFFSSFSILCLSPVSCPLLLYFSLFFISPYFPLSLFPSFYLLFLITIIFYLKSLPSYTFYSSLRTYLSCVLMFLLFIRIVCIVCLLFLTNISFLSFFLSLNFALLFFLFLQVFW